MPHVHVLLTTKFGESSEVHSAGPLYVRLSIAQSAQCVKYTISDINKPR